MSDALINSLNSVVANATPLVIASLGETITERAGMINLSLNGSILLSAMTGFVVAESADDFLEGTKISDFLLNRGMDMSAQYLVVGIGAAMLVGAIIALIVAFSSIYLRQDQVAVGFVLTLLAADLSKFLGQPYNNIPGPTIPKTPIPLLKDIPVAGPILFEHDVIVYFSFFLTIFLWYWLFHSRRGLAHRAVGEHPEAAFARGTKVNLQRYVYTFVGGALVGLAGAAYSLGIKSGWASTPKMDGDGWIALAIVIFGGWHPFRVVLGAYLFAALRAVASTVQRSGMVVSPMLLGGVVLFVIAVFIIRYVMKKRVSQYGAYLAGFLVIVMILTLFEDSNNFITWDIPLVLLNALPWILMLLTLIAVSSGSIDRLITLFPRSVRNRVRAFLQSNAPVALGQRFEPD